RLLDRIRGSAERCPPSLFVNQQPRRARIAAPRLADGPRVEQPAPVGEIDLRSLGRDAAAEGVTLPGERQRDVAVPDEDERRLRQAKAQKGGRLAEDVVPDGVDRAAVEELDPLTWRGGLGRLEDRFWRPPEAGV